MTNQGEQGAPGRIATQQKLRSWVSFPEENPNPVIEIDCAERVTYLNPSARKKFPYLLEIGIIHPLLKRIRTVVRKMCDESKQSAVCEVQLDDVVYELEITSVPGRDRIHIYVNDITAIYRSDMVACQRAEGAVRQLKEPIREIVAFGDRLKKNCATLLNESEKADLEKMLKSAMQMGELVASLLQYTRVTVTKPQISS